MKGRPLLIQAGPEVQLEMEEIDLGRGRGAMPGSSGSKEGDDVEGEARPGFPHTSSADSVMSLSLNIQ